MRRYLFCVNILKLCSNNVKMKTFIYEISISLCIAILQSKTSFSSGLTTRSYTKSWQNKPGQHSIQESEKKIFKSQLLGTHENSSVRECQNCIVYVNGDYLPAQEAKISVLDRGFMFADSVYEVTAVLAGKLLDNDYHVARLHRSLCWIYRILVRVMKKGMVRKSSEKLLEIRTRQQTRQRRKITAKKIPSIKI